MSNKVKMMNFKSITPDKTISLFVKNIWLFENTDKNVETNLPFYADGYPGLMFQQTDSGLMISPHNKTMPEIFLYGQTIKPVELKVSGAYLLVVFQLYPFVLRAFFNIVPKNINDECYHFDDTNGNGGITELSMKLRMSETSMHKVEIISDFFLSIFEKKKKNIDYKIREAIGYIINTGGQQSIRTIAEKSKLNIRTFERRFMKETGLSPKQFSKIIQFQATVEHLNSKDYSKLSDIVYENGFADQSHFIRVFKTFTGKTPKVFK